MSITSVFGQFYFIVCITSSVRLTKSQDFPAFIFLTISPKSCENSYAVGNSLKYERIDKNLLNVFIQVHMQEDLNTTSFDLHLFPLSQVFLRIIVVYFTLTERPSDEKRHEIYANLEI